MWSKWLDHAERPLACSGGCLSKRYGHDGPGVCLGDGQTPDAAEAVPSQVERGDALLWRMLLTANLTIPDWSSMQDELILHVAPFSFSRFSSFLLYYIYLFFSFLFTRTMVSKPGKAEGTNITFCPLEIRHSFFSYFVSNNILPLPRSHQHVCAEIKSVILFTVFKTAIFFKNLRPRVKISSAMNDDR